MHCLYLQSLLDDFWLVLIFNPKYGGFSKLHSVTVQKTAHFIVTTVRAPNSKNNIKIHLRAALNTPATNSPGTPGKSLRVSITSNGRS
jgi:hypothetical protein